MDIEQHYEVFQQIIEKYHLRDVADQIVHEVVGQKVDAQEFADKYNMSLQEAQVFLAFVQKSLEFKKYLR